MTLNPEDSGYYMCFLPSACFNLCRGLGPSADLDSAPSVATDPGFIPRAGLNYVQESV